MHGGQALGSTQLLDSKGTNPREAGVLPKPRLQEQKAGKGIQQGAYSTTLTARETAQCRGLALHQADPGLVPSTL